MSEPITDFRGKYFFLSNFYSCVVEFGGYAFFSSEAAYQATKCADPADVLRFVTLGPRDARNLGGVIKLRPGWDKARVWKMRQVVEAKFRQNPSLMRRLLATGDARLEEGNTWGDRFWGTVNGVGDNYLGRILMDLRTEFRRDEALA